MKEKRVTLVEEVSVAVEEVLLEVLERPQMVAIPDRPAPVQKEKKEQISVERKTIQTPVRESLDLDIEQKIDVKKDIFAPQVRESSTDSVPLLNLLEEESPDITFVRYMEEEATKPDFSNTSMDEIELPSNMTVGETDTATAEVASSVAATNVRDGGVVKSVSRSEAVQGSSLQENKLKEEQELPKTKVKKQTFAQLLKEAKEKADNFEPKFNANILRHLEVHIKDPAGVIHLDIAQEEASIHVRAVVPGEAMTDMQNLGQDMGEALQDMGLALGSYELRSREDQDQEDDFIGSFEQNDGQSNIKAEIIGSNYVIDRTV